MNYIKQLQSDKMEANKRLHLVKEELLEFTQWFSDKFPDLYKFETMTRLHEIAKLGYPVCDTIIEPTPVTNLSGITCACEIEMKKERETIFNE